MTNRRHEEVEIKTRISQSSSEDRLSLAESANKDSVCFEIVDKETEEVAGNTNVILLADDEDI